LGLLPKIPKTPSPTPKTKQVGQKRKKSGTTAKPASGKKRKLFNKLKVAEINLF
jgi:hypothetical protein